jgi:hypothetical protein
MTPPRCTLPAYYSTGRTVLNNSLHAANTVVCCLAAATADTMTRGVSSVIAALLLGTEIYKSFRAPANLQTQIAQEIAALQTEISSHFSKKKIKYIVKKIGTSNISPSKAEPAAN